MQPRCCWRFYFTRKLYFASDAIPFPCPHCYFQENDHEHVSTLFTRFPCYWGNCLVWSFLWVGFVLMKTPNQFYLGFFLKSNVYLLHFPKSKGWTQLNSSKTNFRFIKHNSKFTNDWYSLSYRSKIGSIFTVEQITHKLGLAIIQQHKVIDVLMYLLMIVGVLL